MNDQRHETPVWETKISPRYVVSQTFSSKRKFLTMKHYEKTQNQTTCCCKCFNQDSLAISKIRVLVGTDTPHPLPDEYQEGVQRICPVRECTSQDSTVGPDNSEYQGDFLCSPASCLSVLWDGAHHLLLLPPAGPRRSLMQMLLNDLSRQMLSHQSCVQCLSCSYVHDIDFLQGWLVLQSPTTLHHVYAASPVTICTSSHLQILVNLFRLFSCFADFVSLFDCHTMLFRQVFFRKKVWVVLTVPSPAPTSASCVPIHSYYLG